MRKGVKNIKIGIPKSREIPGYITKSALWFP